MEFTTLERSLAHRKVQSLETLCCECIRMNLDMLAKQVWLLPPHLQTTLLNYLLRQRRWGCKAITEGNVVGFFTKNVSKIDVTSLWLGSPEIYEQMSCLESLCLRDTLQSSELCLRIAKNKMATSLKQLDCVGVHSLNDYHIKEFQSGFPLLESLHLDCPQVTDKGLKRLKRLKHLTSLTMEHATLVTDEGMRHLNAHALTHLALSFASEVTAIDLQNFKCLKKLKLKSMTRLVINGDTVPYDLCNLQSLELFDCRHVVQITPLVGACTALRSLRIIGCKKLENAAFIGLSHLTTLECLSLERLPRLTLGGLEPLCTHGNLRKLVLSQNRILSDLEDPNFAFQLKRIYELELSFSKWVAPSLVIGNDLKKLNFNGSFVKKEHLLAISSQCADCLEKLSLRDCNGFQDDVVETVCKKLTRLTKLDISSSPKLLRNLTIDSNTLKKFVCTDSALETLKLITPNLKSFDCSRSVTLKLTQPLEDIQGSCKHLWLVGLDIGVEEFALVQKMRYLKLINCSKTSILWTERLLKDLLAVHPFLRRVYINHCTFEDASFDPSVTLSSKSVVITAKRASLK